MIHSSNTDILKAIYFAYFNSLMEYWTILASNTPRSTQTFTLKKTIFCTEVCAIPTNSCTGHIDTYFYYSTSM
jgi:hypothetical protein